MVRKKRKYRFVGPSKYWLGRKLRQIRALRDFGEVKAGEMGGWIECEENLSHFGNCWVHFGGIVCDDASVWGNAQIVSGTVFGNAHVSGDAVVLDEAFVYDDADVSGSARVYGNAKIFGEAEVGGRAQVSGYAQVYDYAIVSDDAKVVARAKVHGRSRVFYDSRVDNEIVDVVVERRKE